MTLLKRKSALWHGRAILLLDWVSGPLKIGAARFPREENTSHQALMLSTSGRDRWVGGGSRRDPGRPNGRHSAAASITNSDGTIFFFFTKLQS